MCMIEKDFDVSKMSQFYWRMLDNRDPNCHILKNRTMRWSKPKKKDISKSIPKNSVLLSESWPTKPAESDMVHSPDHYTKGRTYEPWDVIFDWGLGFELGNAVKYISRAGRKNPDKEVEDLEKAIVYIQQHIKRIKAQQSVDPERVLHFSEISELIDMALQDKMDEDDEEIC